jgi:GxxExxY protein
MFSLGLNMQFNDLSGVIIGCAIEVQKQLGAGLLESAYEECLHKMKSVF